MALRAGGSATCCFPRRSSKRVKKIQDTNVICAPAVSQYAAVGVLDAGRRWVEERLESVAAVRRIALDGLSGLGERVTVPRADGAFYFLVRVDGGRDPVGLVERLIRQHRIAVIPGTAFGMDDGCYLRIGYGAVDATVMREGVRRLVAGIRALDGPVAASAVLRIGVGGRRSSRCRRSGVGASFTRRG